MLSKESLEEGWKMTISATDDMYRLWIKMLNANLKYCDISTFNGGASTRTEA